MRILDVRIDNLTKKEILEKISFFIDEPKFHQIATVNPEFVLEAQKNPAFKGILNSTDLSVADGIGIRFAFLRFGKFLKTRLAGVDLMLEILRLAEEKNISVFLATRQDGLSNWKETKSVISKIYPKLKILGDDIDIENKNYRLLDNEAKILFCNFGAPYQEIFLNSQKYAKIYLAMGVGGAFDYLTGRTHRAPKIIRKIGLEWLWRVVLQPSRIRRILRAVCIFPLKIIFN